MGKWQEYSIDNISSCQECKDLHDKYKDEDGQVEDYHEEIPIGEETFSQQLSVSDNKENKKGKKRAYDANLSNLARGDNVRFKKGNYGNSQLDNLEVYDDDEDDDESKDTTYGGKRRRTRRKKTHHKPKTQKRKRTIKKRKSHKKRTLKKRRS